MHNKRNLVVVLTTLLCVAIVGSAAVRAETPQAPDVAVASTFTYQGQIKRLGTLFTGTCDLEFRLWDSATGGLQQGSMLPVAGVSVDNGVFAAELNFGNHFIGQARWLEPAAKCATDTGYTTLPRVALTATPYAIGLMPGAHVQGNISGTAGVLRVSNEGPGAALLGLANSSTGATYGVLGNAFSPNGFALLGYADGGAVGVRGESDSTGAGVWGSSVGGAGVVGESWGFQGVRGVGHHVDHGAVVGFHDAGGVGVFGNSPVGAGVVGTSGTWVGVYGESTAQAGVWGRSINGTGVYGESTNGLAAWFNGRTKTGVLEITGGSDLAERFQVSEAVAEPGTLMCIDADNPGHLTISTAAYDTKVAGIVSGAGGVNPGLTLHQEGVMEGDTEVAIAGRVYVKATALNGPIAPGDLLTTSDVPGHAMRATDRELSPGAIIGKAMTALEAGEGLVLVLVNLQ